MFFKNYQNNTLVVQVGPPKWGFWLKSRNPHFYIPLQAPLNKGLQKKVNLFLWFDNHQFLDYNESPQDKDKGSSLCKHITFDSTRMEYRKYISCKN